MQWNCCFDCICISPFCCLLASWQQQKDTKTREKLLCIQWNKEKTTVLPVLSFLFCCEIGLEAIGGSKEPCQEHSLALRRQMTASYPNHQAINVRYRFLFFTIYNLLKIKTIRNS